MNENIVEEACANIASICERMEKHANDALLILKKIELDDYQEDDHIVDITDLINAQEYQSTCPDCPGCMDCLGLSWTDFM